MNTDLFYGHELTRYHESVADLLMVRGFIYSGIDGHDFCLHLIFSTGALDTVNVVHHNIGTNTEEVIIFLFNLLQGSSLHTDAPPPPFFNHSLKSSTLAAR